MASREPISAAPRPAPGADLQVVDMSKSFGGLKVFSGLSFKISPGEILGVIGPNGAGKTTLINVICGLLRPTSGSVLLGDRDITANRFDAIARLGVVRSFQQTNTFPTATVRQNLARAIRFSGGDQGVWALLDDLIAEFRLAPVLDELSDNLPYGMQKMLGLLMAMATRPKFLMLDEPAAGLERGERTRVDRLVDSARERLGCGILIVEHDMEVIRRLCPRIIVLDAGSVLAQGAPTDVLSRRDVIDAYLGLSHDDDEADRIANAAR